MCECSSRTNHEKNGIVTKKKSTRHAPVRKNSLQNWAALPYKIELLPLSKEDGSGFLAMVPLLKGCQSDGNIRMKLFITYVRHKKHGLPLL